MGSISLRFWALDYSAALQPVAVHVDTSQPCFLVQALWINKNPFSFTQLRENMVFETTVPLTRSAMQRLALGHFVMESFLSHSSGDLQIGQVGHSNEESSGAFSVVTLGISFASALQPGLSHHVTRECLFPLHSRILSPTCLQPLEMRSRNDLLTHFRAKMFLSCIAMQNSALGQVVLVNDASQDFRVEFWQVGHQKSLAVLLTLALQPDWAHQETWYFRLRLHAFSLELTFLHPFVKSSSIFSLTHFRAKMFLSCIAMQNSALGQVVLVNDASQDFRVEFWQVGHQKSLAVLLTLALQPDWAHQETWYFRLRLHAFSLELTFLQPLVKSSSIFSLTHFRTKMFSSHKAMQSSALGQVALVNDESQVSCVVFWQVGHQ